MHQECNLQWDVLRLASALAFATCLRWWPSPPPSVEPCPRAEPTPSTGASPRVEPPPGAEPSPNPYSLQRKTLKKRVEGGAQGKGAADPATPARSDEHGSPGPSENGQGSFVSRPANSGASEPAVESSSADDSSCLTVTEPAGAAAAAAAVRPHAPVLPKVMFADWLDMDYGTSLVALGPDAGVFDVGRRSPAQQGLSHQGPSVQVDGPCGAVDSLHGLGGVGGMCWEFDAAADQLDDVQGGGFCDLLSMSEFLGIN